MLLFKVAFPLVVIGALWNNVGVMIGKILLDSPNKLMIVYNPIKKQYKFNDINYVDLKIKKEKDGVVVHKVTVYIGDGKRTVEIVAFSREQADELTSLLRGMLDHGAMEYPEGDEEPFNFEDEKKEKKGLFSFGRRKENDDKNASEKHIEIKEQTLPEEDVKSSEREKDESSEHSNEASENINEE
jgi:hypothetical protein